MECKYEAKIPAAANADAAPHPLVAQIQETLNANEKLKTEVEDKRKHIAKQDDELVQLRAQIERLTTELARANETIQAGSGVVRFMTTDQKKEIAKAMQASFGFLVHEAVCDSAGHAH